MGKRKIMRNPRYFSLLKRKPCPFCVSKAEMNYKDLKLIGTMVTDGGKIVPRRISGVCASHQRILAKEVKRARNIGLLSFTKGYSPS